MPARHLLGRLRRLFGVNGSSGRRERQARPSAVYVAALNGVEADPVTLRCVSPEGDFTQPALAPSGQTVAYWGRATEQAWQGVWVTSIGGDTQRLSPDGVLEGHPAWYPGEKRVVCFSTADFPEPEPWADARQFEIDRSARNLWSLDLIGGRRVRITDGAYVDERPCVAPDGVTVCFVSNRAGRLNLWSVREDGSALRRLTDGELDYRPAIAPDGSRLAWFTTTARNGSHQLALASWPEATRLEARLDRSFRWVHGPHWFADSQRLLVHGLAMDDVRPRLWVLNTTTGRSEPLVVPGFQSYSHGSIDARARTLAFDSRESLPEQR
jgi:Tol biopolymer transport system component